MEDFEPLLANLKRVFPTSYLEPASEPELAVIRQRYPDVPEHYLAFLRQVGYGSFGNGNFMIYSGLCEPDEIYDRETAASLESILFFWDNFAGQLIGFDTRNDWRIISVDNGIPDANPEDARTVGEFIAQRLAELDEA